MKTKRQPSAFTLVELLVTVSVIGLLVAALLPSAQAARESARRMQCSNNLKQLGLGLQSFHDVHRQLPTSLNQPVLARNGTWTSNSQGWSYLSVLLPYIEQRPLYDKFLSQYCYTTAATDSQSPFVQQEINLFLCPSEAQQPQPGTAAPTNYHGNLGDRLFDNYELQCRGVFRDGRSKALGYNMVQDGLSNTAALSECKISLSGDRRPGFGFMQKAPLSTGAPPSICLQMLDQDGLLVGNVNTAHSVGFAWTDGQHGSTGYFHLLPPNQLSCGLTLERWPLITASSYHSNGVNVCMLDGSVRFINNGIDKGNPGAINQGTISAYGVWGALGSVSGGESQPVSQ